MHNNALVLERYSEYLNQKIQGDVLSTCASSAPGDLHLNFESGFYLRIVFYKNHTFFQEPESHFFPKKNTIPQLKQVVGHRVKQVKAFQFDRAILIEFENDLHANVLCFGRRSGIIITSNNGSVVETFKQPEIEHFTIDATSFNHTDNPKELQALNPFIHRDLMPVFEQFNYYTSKSKDTSLEQIQAYIKEASLYINRGKKYELSILKSEDSVESYTNIGSAFHDFARLYMAEDRYTSLYEQLEREYTKELKKLQKRIEATERHIHRITHDRNHKYMADLIMANLHNIQPDVNHIDVQDFYTGETVRIQLKPKLSGQKNAERYYQKSKNAHLEVQHKESELKNMKAGLNSVEQKLNVLKSKPDYKDLVKLTKQKEVKQKKEKQENLPYKVFQRDDFSIWVGKSAKHNDELLRRMHKNDIWLHARDVAGSHVLIKNPNNVVVPVPVIEYAASLAAKFSKSKNESLAAVIYTKPAHIRKFKGALPGQVRVDREEVVLVEPAR